MIVLLLSYLLKQQENNCICYESKENIYFLYILKNTTPPSIITPLS